MSMVKCASCWQMFSGTGGFLCNDCTKEYKAIQSSPMSGHEYGTPSQLEQDMLEDQERELKADESDEREGVEL